MIRSEQLKAINAAFDAIPDLYDGFYSVSKRLYEMNKASELRHREGAPYGIVHGLTVGMAAKLFTVSHLLDGWKGPDRFSVDDILNIRNEVLYAQAYAKRHHDALRLWAEAWMEPFSHVDYAKLQRNGR